MRDGYTIEEALSILDGILGQQTLNDVQELVFRHAWEDWTYEKIAERFGYTTDYVKNVGSHLWDQLSQLLGMKVTKKNVQAVLRRWAQEQFAGKELDLPGRSPQPHQDWGEAPDIANFTGRRAELAILQEWILGDRCRLVALLGMGGIGKTSLAVMLTRQVESQFEFVLWRSLQNAPPLNELLADLIQFFSAGKETESCLGSDLDSRILRLIHYLRQHRCLLVLDNAEAVLPCASHSTAIATANIAPTNIAPTNTEMQAINAYGKLLDRLSDLSHESCVIITSREKPEEIAWKEGVSLPVRSLQVKGLTSSEGQTLVEAKGRFLASPTEWQILIEHYAGNPLALKMVAAAIQELFNHNISEFLSVLGNLVFDDIRDLLDTQFDRLSELEKEVMYWLAINREVTSFKELLEDLVSPVTKQRLPGVLRLLKHRFLIETSATGFTLQAVVMEYIIDRLVEQVSQELGSRDKKREPQRWGVAELEAAELSIAGLEMAGELQHSGAVQEMTCVQPLMLESPLLLFHRHALVKASSKDYVRESQMRLILQPIADRLLAQTCDGEQLTQHLQAVLAEVRSHTQFLPGYGAGNLINLLHHLRLDLTGLDFSNLAIWQADLRNVDLHQVKLTHADLSRSVFMEALGDVWSVTFAPLPGDDDTYAVGDYLLAASDTAGDIHIWRSPMGQQILTCKGHDNWVCAIAFSADSKLLVSGSADSTVKLWDVKTGICGNTLIGHSDWIVAVAISPDGALIASSGVDRLIKLWDVKTGTCVKTLEGHTACVWAIAFAPTATDFARPTLASSSDDATIKLWDLETGECLHTLEGHSSHVRAISYSPDGKTLVSGSSDRTIQFWDTASGTQLKTLQGHTDPIRSLVFSPNGRTITSASEDQSLRIWDAATGTCLKTLVGHTAHVRSVAYSPDGHTLASGSADHTVKLWDSDSGHCLKTLCGYTNFVLSVHYSPDGTTLASGSTDHTIRQWDAKTGRCLSTIHGHKSAVWAVVHAPVSRFTPERQLLLSSGIEQAIRLWDAKTGQYLSNLQGHSSWVRTLAISSLSPEAFQQSAGLTGSGELLASGGFDHTIRLWDLQTGHCLKVLQGHDSYIVSVAFSPDGLTLASGSDDHQARLWNSLTGECVQILQGHSRRVLSVAFSPDGQILASSSADQTIRLWDVSTGKCLKTLGGHRDLVQYIAFQPFDPAHPQQRSLLASAGSDRTVRLWNTRTGQCLKILQGHSGIVWTVAFSPDGQTIASGSEDGTIRQWDVKTGTCRNILRSPKPYEGMDMTGIKGLTDAQKFTLRALGATEQGLL